MSQKNNNHDSATPKNDSGSPPEISEENKIECDYSGFNFKTPSISNLNDKLISYQKYSNKYVEGVGPNENNDYGYLVYPTFDDDDQKKYNEYLNLHTNLFKNNN